MTVCKETNALTRTGSFTVTGNNPSPSQFELTATNTDPSCIDVTIGPGEYTVIEDENPTFEPTISGDCTQDPTNDFRATGEIQAGETQTCTFFNQRVT